MKSNKKTTEKKESTSKPEIDINQVSEKMLKNYDQAFRTGFRVQEESLRWLTGMFNPPTYTEDWQKRMGTLTQFASNALPITQRRMEDMADYLEKTGRTNGELMKKAIDAAQTPAIAESQNKWMDFWTSSMAAMRTNVESLTNVNTRAIDAWIDYVKKNTEITEIRTPKTA